MPAHDVALQTAAQKGYNDGTNRFTAILSGRVGGLTMSVRRWRGIPSERMLTHMRALRAVRQRLTYANVMSTVAVMVTLGTGTAYAAATITGADIVNGSLTSADIAGNSIGSGIVKNNSLKSEDVLNATITGADIAGATITHAEIANGTVRGQEIQDYSLSNQDIAVLFADVAANGAVQASSGGVTVEHVAGSGKYDVQFSNEQVSFCSPVASVEVFGQLGYAAVGQPSDTHQKEVVTVGYQFAVTDLAFHLILVC